MLLVHFSSIQHRILIRNTFVSNLTTTQCLFVTILSGIGMSLETQHVKDKHAVYSVTFSFVVNTQSVGEGHPHIGPYCVCVASMGHFKSQNLVDGYEIPT